MARRSRVRRSPFASNDTRVPRRRKARVVKVHPNSIAARKLGKSTWTFSDE